jgi:hypothetical protein
LTWTSRLATPAKIDRQNAKPGCLQRSCLLLPTPLIETATVSQHDGTVAFSIQVGMDKPAVLRRKRNVLLRRGESAQCGSGNDGSKSEHKSLNR